LPDCQKTLFARFDGGTLKIRIKIKIKYKNGGVWTDAVGGTPTDAVEKTALPEKSLMIGA
jgi:hypothetical protein